MPKYVIEREIPGAGKLSDAELQAVARKSVSVLKDMGAELPELRPLDGLVAATAEISRKYGGKVQ